MRHTIPGEEERRRDGAAGRGARSMDSRTAANERLTRELDVAQTHERTLMFELANAARDLHEKDFLLHEAEHRLKNTLHLAYNLLLDQARGAGGKDAQAELRSAGERIRAIADLQAGLTQVGDPVRLDEWLPGVCRSMALKPGVEIDVRAPQITVPGAVASPMGLFAWEAVCNALKHAFPGEEGGRVLVQFMREDGDWRLSIADDGRGGDGQIQPGFGLHLLGLLARQLRGRLDIGPGLGGRGLSVSAVFPLPEAARPEPPNA